MKRFGVILLLGIFCLLSRSGWAQVDVMVSGPSDASLCDTVTFSNRIFNLGDTLSGLIVTQRITDPLHYAYVPGRSLVMVGGTVIRTNALADPVVQDGGSNLVWDLSGLVTSGGVSHLLISEVMYLPTNPATVLNQWVELFNPTVDPISITNWVLQDANPGQSDLIPEMTIAPGEYVIIAASTNAFLAQYPAYAGQLFEVADNAIGNSGGLNNFADGVFLKTDLGVTVDGMSYGSSVAAFSPAISLVATGFSLVRDPANEDSNSRNDWLPSATPNPGSGTVRSGIEGGQSVSIVFDIEVACGAVAQNFTAIAAYQQPSGAPTASRRVRVF